jgi:hypothetical protein
MLIITIIFYFHIFYQHPYIIKLSNPVPRYFRTSFLLTLSNFTFRPVIVKLFKPTLAFTSILPYKIYKFVAFTYFIIIRFQNISK